MKKKEKNFVTSFGLRWRLDRTGWSDEHKSRSDGMFGRDTKPPSQLANLWEQHGVYVLYKGHGVVYVGIATRLGKRIRDHNFDIYRGNWDHFSWFGSSKLVHAQNGSGLFVASVPDPPEKPGRRGQTVTPWRVWSDIEALIYRSLYPYRHIQGSPGKEPYFGALGVKRFAQVSEAEVRKRLGT
jgi:hypothetical protein